MRRAARQQTICQPHPRPVFDRRAMTGSHNGKGRWWLSILLTRTWPSSLKVLKTIQGIWYTVELGPVYLALATCSKLMGQFVLNIPFPNHQSKIDELKKLSKAEEVDNKKVWTHGCNTRTCMPCTHTRPHTYHHKSEC